jgi:hypothetical protein
MVLSLHNMSTDQQRFGSLVRVWQIFLPLS